MAGFPDRHPFLVKTALQKSPPVLTGSFPESVDECLAIQGVTCGGSLDLSSRLHLSFFYLCLAVSCPEKESFGVLSQLAWANERDMIPLPNDLYSYVAPSTPPSEQLDPHFSLQRTIEVAKKKWFLPSQTHAFHSYILSRIRHFLADRLEWLESFGKIYGAPEPAGHFPRGSRDLPALSGILKAPRVPPCIEALRGSAHLPFGARKFLASVYQGCWPVATNEVVAMFLQPGTSSKEFESALSGFAQKKMHSMGCKAVNAAGLCPISDIEEAFPARVCRNKEPPNTFVSPFSSPYEYIINHVANRRSVETKKFKAK